MKKLLPWTLALALSACASPTAPVAGTGAPTAPAAEAPAATPAAPMVTGTTLTGTATFGPDALAGATVSAYLPGSDTVLASTTADAAGKFEIPVEKLGTAKLVKLVAKAGDKTVVTLYAVPERAPSGYHVFQAPAGGFTTSISTATTVAYVSLGKLGGLTGQATLSTAQAGQLYQAFQTITTEISKSLDGLTTTTKTSITTILVPVLAALGPTGEGSLPDALGKQLLAQNPALGTALSSGVGSVQSVLKQTLPSGDTVALAQASQAFAFGGQIIATSTTTATITTGGSAGSNGNSGATAGLRADRSTVVQGDLFYLTGVNFGTNYDAVTLTTTATLTVNSGGSGYHVLSPSRAFQVDSVENDKLAIYCDTRTVPGACTLTVSVGGKTVGTVALTVAEQGVPAMTSLSSTVLREGDELTIMGTNIGYYSAYEFSDGDSTWNGGFLRAVPGGVVIEVPEGVGPRSLSIVNSINGNRTAARDVTVSAGAPKVTKITNPQVVAGGDLKLEGNFFSTTPGNNVVTFTGASGPAVVTHAEANYLTVTVPPDAASGPISVSANGLAGTIAAGLPNVSVAAGYRVSERIARSASQMARHGEDVWASDSSAHTVKFNAPLVDAGGNGYSRLIGLDATGTLWQETFDGTVIRGYGAEAISAPLFTGSPYSRAFVFDSANRAYELRSRSDVGGDYRSAIHPISVSGNTITTGTPYTGFAPGVLVTDGAFDANGNLWVIADATGTASGKTRLYELQNDNGTFSELKKLEFGISKASGQQRVFIVGQQVLAIAPDANGWSLRTFDLEGNQLSELALPDYDRGRGMDIDAEGHLVYCAPAGIRRVVGTTITTIVPGAFAQMAVVPSGFWVSLEVESSTWHIIKTP